MGERVRRRTCGSLNACHILYEVCARAPGIYRYEYTITTRARRAWGVAAKSVPTGRYRLVDAKTEPTTV